MSTLAEYRTRHRLWVQEVNAELTAAFRRAGGSNHTPLEYDYHRPQTESVPHGMLVLAMEPGFEGAPAHLRAGDGSSGKIHFLASFAPEDVLRVWELVELGAYRPRPKPRQWGT